jgi:hypothetical protein
MVVASLRLHRWRSLSRRLRYRWSYHMPEEKHSRRHPRRCLLLAVLKLQ